MCATMEACVCSGCGGISAVVHLRVFCVCLMPFFAARLCCAGSLNALSSASKQACTSHVKHAGRPWYVRNSAAAQSHLTVARTLKRVLSSSDQCCQAKQGCQHVVKHLPAVSDLGLCLLPLSVGFFPAVLNLSISIPNWCGKWVVTMNEFSEGMVGAKSKNLANLRGKIPDWIRLPPAVTVPFSSFEQVKNWAMV